MIGHGESSTVTNFVVGPQVDHGSDSEPDDRARVRRGQAVEPIGAKQGTPAGATTIDGGIATEIPKIVDCKERHHPAVITEQRTNIHARHPPER